MVTTLNDNNIGILKMQQTAVSSNPSAVPARASSVGIDWGASCRRVYVFGTDGARLALHEDREGTLAARGSIAVSLDALVGRLGIDWRVPVIVSGIAGYGHRAQLVPCLDLEVPLTLLARQLVQLGARRIAVPGYVQVTPHADVMRGQSTHLLGLVVGGGGDGWAVLPGTYSKWVYLRRGRVVHWRTFVTGELFDSQRHLGTVAPLLESQWSDDPAGFDLGLELARSGMSLSQALYSMRAAIANGAVAAGLAAPMLSGLLIGAEFQAICQAGVRDRSLQLIAHAPQRALYERAAAAFGWETEALDAHGVFGAAVRHLAQSAEVWTR